MKSTKQALLVLAFATISSALIRFQCSQLVVERLDPLVNPGMLPSTHVHQIVGGVSTFAFSCENLEEKKLRLAELLQCYDGSDERYAS
jgi:hypothetical protein